MMGRYSLDEPGLIYAHSGNKDFDSTRYTTFPADDDGIVPVMDMDWFEDDASKRFEEFLKVAWNEETLEENLKFVAGALSPKRGEEPRETIRRFISTSFFKDHHLKVYKKRPIYWLFSSGKNKAFECLVYLHRYNENTLSRMRAMYVTPLQGKYATLIQYLQEEKEKASSASAAKKFQKQLTTMLKKQEELRAFDELLRHYADQRITLDLDDGVKVNYGKFGKLLAEVKAVTGRKAE
jgi:type II restriction/modification system DNA methylase subunit YeeA